MRMSLLAVLVVSIAGLANGRQEATKDSIVVGKDMPGSINPFNVTGPSKGRFHDPIGPHELDPFVLIFTADVKFAEPLKKLLTNLDNAIDKNPTVRLASCCVFHHSGLPNVLDDDDAREALQTQLEGLATELKLQQVILAIDSPDNLPKFADQLVGTRIVLLNKLRVLGVFGGDVLKPEDGDKLIAELKNKLGASRK